MGSIVSRFAAAAAALTFFAASASASANQASQSAKEAAYARKVMHDFAKCEVKSERDLARRFVLMSPSERLPNEEFQKVADWRCLGFLPVRLKMVPFLYKGALAEELVRKDFAGRPAVDPSGLAPLDWSMPAPQLLGPSDPAARQKAWDDRVQNNQLGQLGECVVRASPAGSLAVLNTKVGDPAEMAALKALTAEFASCIRPGETWSFNRATLRSAIALSYYRLAYAASRQEAAK